MAGTCATSANDLPVEVLAYIFQLGLHQGHADHVAHPDIYGRRPQACHDLYFQVLVSHVSRKWRDTALGTATLWNKLTFDGAEKPLFARLKEWIVRSKECPLVIKLEFGSMLPPKLAITQPETSLDGSRTEKVPRLKNVDVNKAYFIDVLNIIMPQSHRWKFFELSAKDFAFFRIILNRMDTYPAAPLLESFTLRRLQPSFHLVSYLSEFHPLPLREPFTAPFLGYAPRLKSLALHGVHINWTCPRMVSNLTELQLHAHTLDVRPSFQELRDILMASSCLQSLSLDCSGPAVSPSEDVIPFSSQWPSETIDLPALRHLHFACGSASYTFALWHRLRMSALKSLSVASHDSTMTIEKLTELLSVRVPAEPGTPGNPSDRPFATQLEHLSIGSLCGSSHVVAQLLSILPFLRSMSIDCHFVDNLDILSCLSVSYRYIGDGYAEVIVPGVGAEAECDAFSHPLPVGINSVSCFCPRLDTLTIVNVPWSYMQRLITFRRSWGCPIKNLDIKNDFELEKKGQEWLRERVGNVEFHRHQSPVVESLW